MKWIVKIQNLSLRRKMVMAFGGIVVLPIIFVGMFLTGRMKTMALEQSLNEANNGVVRVTEELERLMDFNANLQNTLIAEASMYEVIHKEYKDTLSVVKAYQGFDRMSFYESTYEEVDDIRIYVNNQSLLNNMDFMRADESVYEAYWFRQSLLGKGQTRTQYYYDPIRQKEYLMISRGFTTSKGYEGVVMTLVSLKYIKELINNEAYNIQILDSGGVILGKKGRTPRGTTLYDTSGLYVNHKNPQWRMIYQGEKSQMLLSEVKMPYMTQSLYVLAAIPLVSILQKANEAGRLGMGIITVSTITAFVLILMFSNILTKGINHLKEDIMRVSVGDFQGVRVYDRKDEFGILSSHFYHMSQNIVGLMAENSKIKEKEQSYLVAREQMKFEVLSSQINPHFLFNILESLRMKAHMSGVPDIATIVKLLGQSMRRTLEMNHEKVTIKEEIDFVEHYFILQKFRYEERLSYTILMDESCARAMILPLILQPLVENAISHGLEPLGDGGHIQVQVMVDNGQLKMFVEDNGVGIPRQLLERINDNRVNESLTGRRHIGLDNIKQRIAYYYGGKGRLNIESTEGKGTKVLIQIPLEEVGYESNHS